MYRFILIVLALISVSALADIPQYINYQGYLTDDVGDPVADGDYSIVFIIYDAPTDGTIKWASDRVTVPVENGLFSKQLGPIPTAVFSESSTRYLGIKVEGEDIDPRTQLIAVPYSFYSVIADTAMYAPSGWVDDGDVVRLETATDNVGIGTTTPTEKLDVDGNLKVSGKANIGSGNTNPGTEAFVAGQNNDANGNYTTIGGGADNDVAGNYSTIAGGQNNSTGGYYNAITGGSNNRTSGLSSSIAGGKDNRAGGDYSFTVGYADSIGGTGDYSVLFGIDSDLDEDSTFMVDMPHIRFGDATTGYEFPTSDGTADQVMSTNGSGQLSWSAVAGGGPDGDWTIAGSDMYSAVSGNVGIGTSTPSEKLRVENSTSGNSGYIGGDSVGVYGETPLNTGIAVYGKNTAGFGTFGCFGGQDWGAYGKDIYSGNWCGLGLLLWGAYAVNGTTDNIGGLASEDYGVYGKHNDSQNYGYLGGDNVGVYGYSSSGNAGEFNGNVRIVSGNVGIGTFSPSDKLSVDNSVSGTSGQIAGVLYGVRGVNGTAPSYGYLGGPDYGAFGENSSSYGYLGGDNSGVYGKHVSSQNYGYLGGDNVGVYGYSSSGNAGEFNGNVRIVSGNVGIGTFSPSDKLSVDNSVSGTSGQIAGVLYGVRGVNGTAPSYGYLGGPDYGAFGENSSSYGYLGGDNSGVYGKHVSSQNYGYLGGDNVGVYGNAGSAFRWSGFFDDDVYIADTLAIGSTDPKGILSIQGVGNVDDAKLIVLSEDNTSEFAIESGFNGTTATGKYIKMTTSWGNNPMTWRGDGNVGIGTVTPNGPIHIQSTLSVGSGSNFTNRIAPLVVGDGDGSGYCLLIDGNNIEEAYTADGLHINSDSPSDVYLVNGGGEVGIGTMTPGTKLAVVGLTGTSSYNNVKVNTTTGDFYFESSSKKYKDNIQDFEQDFSKIYQAEPKIYTDKASGQREIGFIAEEFDALGLNELVIYDADSNPIGLKYDKISLYLLELMKNNDTEMSAMQEKIDRMEKLLMQLVEASN